MSYCIINQFILFFLDFSQQFGYFCNTMMIFSLESFVLSFAFYCLCYRFIGIAPLPLSLTSSVLLVAPKKFPHLSFFIQWGACWACKFFSFFGISPALIWCTRNVHRLLAEVWGYRKSVMYLPELCVFLPLMFEDPIWNTEELPRFSCRQFLLYWLLVCFWYCLLIQSSFRIFNGFRCPV